MDELLEVYFSPAEYQHLPSRDLSGTVCVVFDILRATTSMITALANGARSVIPVPEIADALHLRRRHPEYLLAGERQGFKISAQLTGSIDFDFGNSPREFTKEAVQDKTIVLTTTNGTRALRACAQASRVLVSSFHNLQATADWIFQHRPKSLLLVCSGTHDQSAFEDTLAAGALLDALWNDYAVIPRSDSVLMALEIYRQNASDLLGAVSRGRNGVRLLGIPELREDVAFCIQKDLQSFVPLLDPKGVIHR